MRARRRSDGASDGQWTAQTDSLCPSGDHAHTVAPLNNSDNAHIQLVCFARCPTRFAVVQADRPARSARAARFVVKGLCRGVCVKESRSPPPRHYNSRVPVAGLSRRGIIRGWELSNSSQHKSSSPRECGGLEPRSCLTFVLFTRPPSIHSRPWRAGNSLRSCRRAPSRAWRHSTPAATSRGTTMGSVSSSPGRLSLSP